MGRVLTNVQGFSIFLAFGAIRLLVGTGIMASLYSDWALSAIAGNLAGIPSGDVSILYLSFFVAKRLPFFSFCKLGNYSRGLDLHNRTRVQTYLVFNRRNTENSTRHLHS